MRRNTNPKWFRRTQFLMVGFQTEESNIIAHQDHRELRELEEGWGDTQGRVVDFLLKRLKPRTFQEIQKFLGHNFMKTFLGVD